MNGLSIVHDSTAPGRLCVAPPAPAVTSAEALAAMSHELRLPLNVVVNLVDLLQQTGPNAEQREYLDLLRIAASSLLSAANGVLEFSRLDAEPFELRAQPFSLRGCLDDTLRLLAVEARPKGLALRGGIAPEVPDALLGDPLRLRQILVNLVGNAIKFAERGEIAVRVALLAGNADEVSCRFSVSDQGIGIAPEQQAAIFAPYRQLAAGTGGGYGLGLAISARLVELMDGKIWVDSMPGAGSTFHFTACFGRHPMPVEAAATLPPAPAPSAGQPATILLVEDNPTNRRLTRIVLEKAGYRVLQAASGLAACACLEHETPDAILMDLQLPGLDGFQTTAAIRRHEAAHGGHVPIIALTARALSGDSARCLHAGMDAYLAKPVEPASLRATLAHVAGRPAAETARRPAVLDRPTLLARVDGDPRLLHEVCALFLRDYARLLAGIRQLAGGGDGLAAVLHTLRGMCQSLAAPAAEAAVCALEDSPPGSRLFLLRQARLEFEIRRLQRTLLELTGNAPRPAPRLPRSEGAAP